MTDLAFDVLDSSETALTKTSTLVYGDEALMIVDTGLTASQAHRIVAAALETGRPVTHVLISGAGPDFHLGAGIVSDAFPDAHVFATARVVDRIVAAYDRQVAHWARLGRNLPTRRAVIEAWAGDAFEFEGRLFELRAGGGTLGWRGDYLWQPQSHTVLGGALLYGGDHVWTAGTPSAAERAEWAGRLRELQSVAARLVVPGHRRPGWRGDPVTWTLEYLDVFEQVIAATDVPAAAARTLRERFPDAGLVVAVDIGVTAAMGRTPHT
ncbi:MBL fold metallo-hydrolase [Cellulomonas cellasea]|uniref:MBL fold metallo-hydrolase n=1 Tax=Cellulomonas cellasea TaxID=43670 RepID=UPI0025A34332|nr:MBL fold metallo-hydrolase [Cellulomonas cellasea]MDM8084910.1 MBL fold metallo-hydrolase [Cellulomonas cellasea]